MSKPSPKSAVSSGHRNSAPAVVAPASQAEEPPRLRSNRPVKSTGGGGTSFTVISDPIEVAAAAPPAPAPVATDAASRRELASTPSSPGNLPGRKTSVPAKPPSRKSHPPAASSNTEANSGSHNAPNLFSSSSSMATEKTGQRSAPPSLPLHRPTNSHDAAVNGSEESDGGIVESSRSYLTRLSLEDAVVALERLRFLMMSHTAAVTGSQAEQRAAAEALPSPQQMHVDPFKLSKRPLEDIAEELCSQLRRLTSAYAVASAADRCLLGVKDPRRPTAPFADNPMAPLPALPDVGVKDVAEGNEGELLGTFGPMVSTLHMMRTIDVPSDGANLLDTHLSAETEDSWEAIDLHKPNPGPRIAYPQRGDSETGQDFGSTVYKYPNGTVVSYPVSTFGELVSTESGQGTTFRSRGANTIDVERRVMVSDGTQTDDSLEPTKKEKDLQAYVKALESYLTEKQRLQAMRESRGAKKSSISESLSKLARSVDNTQSNAGKSATAGNERSK